MGSRKGKPLKVSSRSRFLTFWKTLDVHQKIAFKGYWWNYGRHRIHFVEFFTDWFVKYLGYPSDERLKNNVEWGYFWMNVRKRSWCSGAHWKNRIDKYYVPRENN